ncbi:MAG: DUF5810 domain-containing protein [Natronomonas sp.]
MGYRCPVCEDPQADAGHLANHLALTAILGDDAHERWLETNTPDWETMGEADLAPAVAEAAEEVDFPQVFEDTVGDIERKSDPLSERSGMLFRDESRSHSHDPRTKTGDRNDVLDEETAAIIEEAKDMTHIRRGEEEGDG